ncbi:hypothetical protein ACFVIM_03110 [Streptomyces sp. NPDC057638]|uniref:hypothetical protein n=1 Tax=Streptomyces sp. NPDC057638 TaxID=3346190 RepID=UPI003687DDBD
MASRALTAALAAVALTAGAAPGLAQARPATESIPGTLTGTATAAGERLPKGWRVDGGELVWSSPEAVGMGASRVEFRSGDRFLGFPAASEDHRTFRLSLAGVKVGAVSELQVVAGQRRLDAAGADQAPGQRRAPAAAVPQDPLPPNPVDPGVAGKYRTTSGEYTLKSVKLPGYAAPIEMKATVVGPTDAPGKRPLALFLHGRHATCYKPGSDEPGMEWPCPTGQKAIPSYRGYLHDQKRLASQGYVTVSISANGVNAQDAMTADAGAQARSSLVRQHLGRWAQWGKDPAKAPKAVRAADPADLNQVLLVGHSRGGEGVNRAALDSVSPPPSAEEGYRGPVEWRIRGTVLIGPTIFGQNPADGVPSMTILPGCDGDVSDLQGQMYLDATRGVGKSRALHSAVYMVGANHNFFNTEWTPGQAEAPANDDFWDDEDNPDAVCSAKAKTRLTARQQQQAGTTYIAAAARLFLAGDDRVRPLLDGSDRSAPSAGKARVYTHAVGGHRTPAISPDGPLTVTNARVCEQITSSNARACLKRSESGLSPHFASWGGVSDEPGRNAVLARWTKPGTPVTLTPQRSFSLAGSDSLALRVIVPPNTRGTQLDVALTDASGKRAKLGQVTVDGLPGTDITTAHWAREVRVPLKAAVTAGLDLKRAKALELTPRTTSGRFWLVDASGWRPGTAAVRPGTLPRVDIGQLAVREGDSGTRTYTVPVKVTGKGTGTVKLAVMDPATYKSTVRTVAVRAGAPVDVSIAVKGNNRYNYDLLHEVAAKAVTGTAIGGATGGVLVQNDDAKPTITVTPVADSVTEGQKLTWKATLSRPADTYVEAAFALLPVREGTELSTKDVDANWLAEHIGEPDPVRPLSDGDSSVWTYIEPGTKSTEVSVPTITDTLAESEESLRMRVYTYDENGDKVKGPLLTGKVKDAARQR